MSIFLAIHFLLFIIYNLGHPVTHAFLANINGPDYLQGTLLAMMALGGFFFAPIWGQLADKYGYKIMAIAPLGYAFGQLGFVFLSNPLLLIIFRFIAGSFSCASMVIHFIYITKKSPTKAARTRNLGLAALLSTGAAGVGYVLGGYIGNANPRLTFVVQIILSIIIGIVFLFFIEKESHKKIKIRYDFITQNIGLIRDYASDGLGYIVLLTFINVIANNVMIMSQILPQLGKVYHIEPFQTGIIYAIGTTLTTFLSYVFVHQYLGKIINHTRLLPYLSLFSASIGLLIYPLLFVTNNFGWILLMILFISISLFNTIFVTIIQELLLHLSNPLEHGKITGVNQSFQSLAVFIGSFGASFLFAFSAFSPIVVGIGLFMIVTAYNFFLIKRQKV